MSRIMIHLENARPLLSLVLLYTLYIVVLTSYQFLTKEKKQVFNILSSYAVIISYSHRPLVCICCSFHETIF